MGPETVRQSIIVIVCVLPGAVYQVSLARMAGESPANRNSTDRVLRALAASLVIDSIYALVLGSRALTVIGLGGGQHSTSTPWAASHLRWTGLLVLTLVFALPATAAWLTANRNCVLTALVARLRHRFPAPPSAQSGSRHSLGTWLEGVEMRVAVPATTLHDPTPTAWDWAVLHGVKEAGFVRVRTEHGWRGGMYGERSFFTDYPTPPAVFVEQAWQLDEKGAFVATQNGTAGAWIDCQNAATVEFLSVAAAGDEPTASIDSQ